MTGPAVSVAMTSYNGARYLREQLDSIARQSVLPVELVIGDDGSNDDSVAIAQDFGRTAPFPVMVERNVRQLGYRANFMATAARCRGDLIAFSDQDDIWQAEKIATMASVFDDPGVLLAFHNARIVDDRGVGSGLLYDAGRQRAAIASGGPDPYPFSLGFTQVYRRRLHAFDDLWPRSADHVKPGERLAHDQWFFFLAQALGRVAFVDAPLVDYRQHDANVFGAPKVGVPASRFAFQADPDGARAAAAAARAEVARAVAARCAGVEQAAVLAAADCYGRLTTRLTHWNRTVSAPGFLTRLAALSANLRDGYFGSDPWRFRASWIVGDALRMLRGPSRPQ